jgi:predicted nucleotidyltransferase
MAQDKAFDRTTLEQALYELGRRAHTEGKTIEIAIYGGSALMLTYDWRVATRDVDAVFEVDRSTIRRLAKEIAEENDWDPNWLNDGVKGFLSAADASEALDLVAAFYPDRLIEPKTRFGLEEIFDRLARQDGSASP